MVGESRAGLWTGSAMFMEPDHLEPVSAWVAHVPFAFWIVEALRPSIFVELGTQSGTSYFAFCQAIAALHLPVRCYAVDTWQGDEHAGLYDEHVFEAVNARNDLKYAP